MVEASEELHQAWRRRLEKVTCFELGELYEHLGIMGDMISLATNTEHDLCHFDNASPHCQPNVEGLSKLLGILREFEEEVDRMAKQRKCEITVETPYGTKLNI